MAKTKARSRRTGSRAIAHVQATFNNTKVTITDLNGDVLCWESAGSCGFSSTRKSTPFAAQRAGERAGAKAKKMGIREVDVKVKGPGSGRESAISALESVGIIVHSIEDVTPLPHNGCRPPKRRRI
jgi:small subunit ribosomal protein S11